MRDLTIISEQLVRNNVKSRQNELVINSLTAAVSGLFLVVPELTAQKMPVILRNINIIFNQSQDSLDEKFGNAVSFCNLNFDQKNNKVSKNRTLIISSNIKDGIPSFNLISTLIEECIQLMRVGTTSNKDDKIIITEGISKTYFPKTSDKIIKKHANFEKGIVQNLSNKVVCAIGNELSNCNGEIPFVFTDFFEQITSCEHKECSIPAIVIEKLCCDEEFNNLITAAQNNPKCSKNISEYYNSVMGSIDSFSKFTKQLDLIQTFKNEDTYDSIKRILDPVYDQISQFLNRVNLKKITKQKKF